MSDVQRRLDEIATNGRPVLALDLDDVLSSTHLTAAQCMVLESLQLPKLM
jgi:hypothetical protein